MIEDAALKYLGIYPEVIQRADDICERICEEYGIDSDEEVWPSVLDWFELEFGLKQSGQRTFTNALIMAAFSALDTSLQAHGVDDERIEYYVDGICSEFTVEEES